MSKTVQVVLAVKFFRTDAGNEPVREWLKSLGAEDRRTVGEDIKTVQIGWPIGTPLVRKMGKDLWEIRIHLHRRIARVLFTVVGGDIALLHGFIKKVSGYASGRSGFGKGSIAPVEERQVNFRMDHGQGIEHGKQAYRQ